jgi:hypothetical protein
MIRSHPSPRVRVRRCIAALACAVVLARALVPQGSLAQVVTPDAQVSTFLRWQAEPSVAALGDHVVATWDNAIYVGAGAGWGYSLDGGMTWTDGQQFPSIAGRIAGGQATVCADNDGNFYAAALGSDCCGWTIFLYRGLFQGSGFAWQSPGLIVPSSNASNYDSPYERPWLTCDPERGFLYLTYTSIYPVFAPTYSGYRHELTIYFTRSLDRGATWSAPVPLSGAACNGSQPAVGPDGELYVVWEDFAALQVLGRKSTDFGASFGPVIGVGPILDNLGTHPQGWRAPIWRYNPVYPLLDRLAAPDFPSIAIDGAPGPRRGTVYVAWSDYGAGAVGPSTGLVHDPEPNDFFAEAAPITPGADIEGYALSADFGGPDCDNYSFDGVAGTTVWISGEVRYASPGTNDGSPNVTYYSLYCAADTTRELLFNAIQDSSGGPLPPLIYTLPMTGRYYIAMACPGYSSVAYTLHTRVLQATPGQAARDMRDIVVASSSDGGATWSAKRRANDDPPQYDECLPALAVDGLGALQVTWYDRRDDPGCGKLVNTYWTQSLDGGVTFQPAVRLSSQSGSWQFLADGSATNIGDHLGVTASGDRTWVLWTDDRGVPNQRVSIYGATIRNEIPTAVAVSGFRAEPGSGGVSLRWSIADPARFTGFRVTRSQGSDNYQFLEDVAPVLHGAGEYEVTDRGALPGTRYWYKLEAITADGGRTWFGPVEIELPAAITRLLLEQALPNPFHESLRLTLAVPVNGEASVRVYDLFGHEVATVARGPTASGRQMLAWDGRGRSGRAVPPGVYLVRAEQGREISVRRVIRIR